jgi:hypothetical protein
VIVAGRRRLPPLPGVVIHRPKDLERLRPPQPRSFIACTNILLALLDLGTVDREAVPDAVGHAIAHHHVTLPTLESVIIQHSEQWRAGIVALRNAADDWAIDSKQTDSLLQTAMQRLIDRYRLPPVEFNPVVCGKEVAIFGDPDQVVAKLRSYFDLRIEALILSGYPHPAECDLIAQYVLPAL